MSSGNNDDKGENEAARAPHEALHTIGLLFEPGDVIEIRALDVGRTVDRAGTTYSGYFNFENAKAIDAAIRRVDGRAEGVYVVLNRFHDALLMRANNRLQARPKHTTSDDNILQRRWLYIDADPVRASGISATEEEHQAAIHRAEQIREFLRSLGWPEALFADSGNGAHLLYRLPAIGLAKSGSLVKLCLKALAARFSDAVVTVDESTASAARLCKLYGTMARKGDSSPERPHRRARIIDEPEQRETVAIEALEILAREAEKPRPTVGSQTKALARPRFRIDEWLRSSGLEIVKGPEPYDGGRKWTLRTCPFNSEHVKPVIIELLSGAMCYKCLHTSCADCDWKALRTLVEPGYRDQPPAHANRAKESEPLEAYQDTTPLITDLSQIPSVWTLESNLEWCVEDMIAQGSVTLISAESGTGKTWLAYYIAACVARGVPVIGRRVNQSEVLYLDGENPLYLVKQRLRDLGIEATPSLTIWGGWNGCPPPQPDDPLVVDFARGHKGLIIFDSLIEFHPGSEQSSTETRAFMRQFRALANLGASVVVLHNAGKAETSKLYRGSSDIKAAVDTAYQLRATDDTPERLGRLHLSCFKGRLMPGQSFGLEFREKQGFVSCETPRTRSVYEIISEILEAQPGSNQTQIVTKARAEGCTKRQGEDCLKTGPWKRTPGPNNSTLYDLPPDEVV